MLIPKQVVASTGEITLFCAQNKYMKMKTVTVFLVSCTDYTLLTYILLNAGFYSFNLLCHKFEDWN